MNKKILIVDDDKLLRDNLAATFKKDGFDVILAQNGILALQILEKDKPDFILLDLIMPAMDGVEVIKNIALLHPDLIPNIIVMTNADDMAHMADVINQGVKVYVNKSTTDLDKILEMVKERLK